MAPVDIRERLYAVFTDALNVDIPSPDTELIESGVIDSLQLVELLAALEEAFDLTVSVEDLDIANFRTFERLAAFIAQQHHPALTPEMDRRPEPGEPSQAKSRA